MPIFCSYEIYSKDKGFQLQEMATEENLSRDSKYICRENRVL